MIGLLLRNLFIPTLPQMLLYKQFVFYILEALIFKKYIIYMCTQNMVSHKWDHVIGSMIYIKVKRRIAYIKFGTATEQIVISNVCKEFMT